MRGRGFRPIALAVAATILLLSTGGGVSAQDAEPPPPVPHGAPHFPARGPAGPVSPQGQEDEKPAARPPFGRGAMGAGGVGPLVALGEPGLSFRYVQTYGVTQSPYVPDTDHLYTPDGMFVDGDDNLYVTEEYGYRMLEFASSGTSQLVVGHPGQPWSHDDFLSYPRDVALDGDGNIWIVMVPALKEFDADGNVLQVFPETDPWMSGEDNDRFNEPHGIAFDSAGLLYVSDTWNHRIQVYDISGGTPVYSETIGETGVSGSDNAHFDQPSQIAFDSSDRLYVMDTGNYRVQRCEYAVGWSCTTFLGVTGVPGDDLTHMGWAYGITIDGADNIFVADGDNFRVLKCDTSGTCAHFAGVTGEQGLDNDHFYWPADTAIDSAGDVYVSDWDIQRVQKFDSSGLYLDTLGVTRIPYVTDADRLNRPWGIAVASDGSLYVGENRGDRLIKLSSSGAQLWTVGEPGVYGDDDDHLGSYWTGPEGSLALDSSGNVYIPDTGNARVQIFDPSGTLVGTFGTYGSGNYQFDCPAGVAVSPVNDDIFVVDRCNQRIQVYNNNRIYKATIGTTGETGTDNDHLNWPWGVAVNSSGEVYIADTDNDRVQKCTVSGGSGVCTTFVGELGVADFDFAHLSPVSVAVDPDGRVYVGDGWNSRVQVFDSGGAYLTTLGGYWGGSTGEMRFPTGIAFDSQGNLYISDAESQRVQKYAEGVPGWGQSNINGFGNPDNAFVLSLYPFGGRLYAGTLNLTGSGTQLWRLDGGGWSSVMTDGFSNPSNDGIDDLIEFNGELYAGTWADEVNGGEIWRSSDGSVWSRVVSSGFGDPTNGEVIQFAVFDGQLYGATWSWTETHGAEVWRSNTGDSGSWSQVVSDGFDGDSSNFGILLEVYDGYLYAATCNDSTGAEVWRAADGTGFEQVNTEGFGDVDNWGVSSLAVFDRTFYAGVGNDTTGGQIWRCDACDGTDWEQVVGDGFGDSSNLRVESLISADSQLYAITFNQITGMEVWRSSNGTSWVQINPDGFGDSNNWSSYWDNPATVFNGTLYLGTRNWGNGGEVWKLLHDLFLPLIVR
jgi:hypothetical protein